MSTLSFKQFIQETYLTEDSDQPDELTTEQKMEMFKQYLTHMSGLSPEERSTLYRDDEGNWTGWRSDLGGRLVYKMIKIIKNPFWIGKKTGSLAHLVEIAYYKARKEGVDLDLLNSILDHFAKRGHLFKKDLNEIKLGRGMNVYVEGEDGYVEDYE